MADRVGGLLEEAQRRGFLGPGRVLNHVHHALPLVEALPAAGVVVDLGSGGGVPALVLAVARPGLSWVLVESRQRRAHWLEEAAARAGVGDRVAIHAGRAEELTHTDRRGSAAAVTARSFGPPAVTAECGAPLLAVGGMLWVAEPPDLRPGRWPAEGLRMLGLRVARQVPGWAGFEQTEPCAGRFARRSGVPAKTPLF